MDSVSPTINSLRQQFGAFVAFHFAQKRISHVATFPSISLLHLGRVGTLLGLHLSAWHNLGRWEAFPLHWAAFLLHWVSSSALAVL